MKRCSLSSATRKMEIKMTMRAHFTPMKMAIFKNSVWGYGETGSSCTASGKGKWYSHFVKVYQLLKNFIIEVPDNLRCTRKKTSVHLLYECLYYHY
jgi:hypothetical protein